VGVGVGVGPEGPEEDDDSAPLPQEAARKSKGTRKSDATYFMSRIDAEFFRREVCHCRFRAGFLPEIHFSLGKRIRKIFS
jgi:hypothetical protein